MFTFKKIALLGAVSLTAFAMSCSDDDKDDPAPDLTDLKTGSITLSSAGESYGDIDSPAAQYKQAAALTAATAKKIDLIAFAGFGTGANLFVPMADGIDGSVASDFFWTLPEADQNALLGVYGCELPAAGITAIQGAKTNDELKAFMTEFFADFIATCDDLEELPIANGKGYIVNTSDEKFVAVILSDVAASSVKLNLTYIPE